MAKRHYIPVTADVPGAASEGNCALIRKVIRTALAAEGVTMWTIGVPLAFLGAVTFQLPVERVVLLVTAVRIFSI